ncbi:hypothetical protein COO60DRAFT_248418 [Scenedesmus sp. NREL 46B-D3]|nr:hypothetical protein COO60DRAFT_248418 [Scenedesmus sp. NREL 46B-D3]
MLRRCLSVCRRCGRLMPQGNKSSATILHPGNYSRSLFQRPPAMPQMNPGASFPASWRNTPQNQQRWSQMASNTDYLRSQAARQGSLDCQYCGMGPLKIHHWSEKSHASGMATVDHVVPTSRGGSNQPSNLAVSCQPCIIIIIIIILPIQAIASAPSAPRLTAVSHAVLLRAPATAAC